MHLCVTSSQYVNLWPCRFCSLSYFGLKNSSNSFYCGRKSYYESVICLKCLFQFHMRPSFGTWILLLPGSVCLCVSLCVNTELVVQNTLVKILVVLGVHWPWTSRSNLTLKWQFTQFCAYPLKKSPPIEARTTTSRQKIQNILVKIPIVLEIDWTWDSRWNLKVQITLGLGFDSK